MTQFWDYTLQGSQNVGDLAFQLHGAAVPEPASMAALGLGTFAFLGRKKK